MESTFINPQPLVVPLLHSGATASGLQVYKICRLRGACVYILYTFHLKPSIGPIVSVMTSHGRKNPL